MASFFKIARLLKKIPPPPSPTGFRLIGSLANFRGGKRIHFHSKGRLVRTDWRNRFAVTSIKTQRNNDCWAHGVVEAVESLVKIITGRLRPLSVQELLDHDTQNMGFEYFESGIPYLSYEYILRFGISFEDCYYPYDGIPDISRPQPSEGKVKIDSWHWVFPSEDELKRRVSIQPITVVIETCDMKIVEYTGGYFEPVLDESTNIEDTFSHVAVLVGWDTDPIGRNYWIIKFAWGPDFGDNGYMNLGFRRSVPGRDGFMIAGAMYATMGSSNTSAQATRQKHLSSRTADNTAEMREENEMNFGVRKLVTFARDFENGISTDKIEGGASSSRLALVLPKVSPSRAVMASDFSLPQFRFLERLLIAHGHWSYKRIFKVILYFVYKNIAFGLTLFYYTSAHILSYALSYLVYLFMRAQAVSSPTNAPLEPMSPSTANGSRRQSFLPPNFSQNEVSALGLRELHGIGSNGNQASEETQVDSSSARGFWGKFSGFSAYFLTRIRGMMK